MNFEEAVKKLSAFNLDYTNNKINIFVYFLQNLFLDEKKIKLDFDLNQIYTLVPQKTIINILELLMARIKEFNFFKFLVDIGGIFTKLYFESEIIKKEVEQYEHKYSTNYECLLLVLCSCKNNKYNKLLFGNFDAYYAI